MQQKDLFDIFEVADQRRRIDDADILVDLRRFADVTPLLGRTIKGYEAWDRRQFHPHTVMKYFGSWSAAMRLAGVDYDAKASIRVSKEEVDDNLREFAKVYPAHKRTLDSFQSWQFRRVGASSIRKYYDNWYEAMMALGYECPGKSKSKKNSDEDLLEATERVWRWSYEKRRQSPSNLDFQKYSDIYSDGISYGTLYRRFGPVDRYLKAFSAWKRNKISKSELLNLRPEKKDRSPISARLRFDLLEEAGFKCSKCGASASNGVTLHVDHIKPTSKGGTNERENLRILCEPCNLGRSNRYES